MSAPLVSFPFDELVQFYKERILVKIPLKTVKS